MALAALSESVCLKPEPQAPRFVRSNAKVTRLLCSPPPASEATPWFAADWRTPVTANDLRDLVRLLRKHPAGLPEGDAHDVFRKRLLDPRKLAAYREWQVVTTGESLIRLTPFGQTLADGFAPEAQHFRALLHQCLPFRQTLTWLQEQQLLRATDNDITNYWQTQWPSTTRTAGATAAEAQMELKTKAVSFFHLCQAADFGIVTLGKRGQPTRLRVDQAALSRFLHGGPADTDATTPPQSLRVAISFAHTQAALANHLQMALSLADIRSELLMRDADGSHSPNWRGCNAGLLIVSGEEQTAGSLAENVWLSLGAATALYADRLLLLWEKPAAVPERLARWRRCEFNGAGLTWQLGAQIVEAMKAFR
jgi:hypothetical protein